MSRKRNWCRGSLTSLGDSAFSLRGWAWFSVEADIRITSFRKAGSAPCSGRGETRFIPPRAAPAHRPFARSHRLCRGHEADWHARAHLKPSGRSMRKPKSCLPRRERHVGESADPFCGGALRIFFPSKLLSSDFGRGSDRGIIQKELEPTAALLGLWLALQNPRQSCFNAKFPAATSAGFFVCYRTGTAELVKRF